MDYLRNQDREIISIYEIVKIIIPRGTTLN